MAIMMIIIIIIIIIIRFCLHLAGAHSAGHLLGAQEEPRTKYGMV